MNRKSLLICAFLFGTQMLFAQDIIVTNEGESLKVYNMEIGPSAIFYQLSESPNAEIKRIAKSDVLIIRKTDGTKIDPNADSTGHTAESESERTNLKTADQILTGVEKGTSQPQLIKKPADTQNTELINSHNHECYSSGKWPNSSAPAKCGYVFYWISPSSVMSNDEIEMSFVRQLWEGFWHYYVIKIKNKTDKILYLDLANCFRTSSVGDVRCYYEDAQTTISQGNSSGTSVGLGAVAGALGVGGAVGQLANGVSVGGGSSDVVSTTYTQQRFISIPPHGQRNLSDLKRVFIKGNRYKTVSEAEDFDKLNIGLQGKTTSGETVFDENTSPFFIDYLITYSTFDDFSKYSTLHSKLYLQKIIGCKNKVAPWSLSDNVDKYVKGVNDSIIMGIKNEME